MSSGDDLLERLLGDWSGYDVSLKAISAMEEAADRIRTLQASNMRLSGMFYDLTSERDRLQAQVRFLERKAVESAKKA